MAETWKFIFGRFRDSLFYKFDLLLHFTRVFLFWSIKLDALKRLLRIPSRVNHDIEITWQFKS